MSEGEKLLLDRSKSGDVAAFEQLIEGYQRKIFNIALRIVGNYDDAGDLAQEVLIRIYKSIRNFKEQSSFSTWVYRITTNVCLDEIRKRKNRKVISLDEELKFDDGEMSRQIASDDPLPEDTAERSELREIVNNAINSLSEEHRVVIILRDIQGFSYEEIAEMVKCPEGTIKSRINRARQALRNILQEKRELLYGEYVK